MNTRIEELENQVAALQHLLKMSQENEGFCLIDRERYKAGVCDAERVIEHAFEIVNEVQSKIGEVSIKIGFTTSLREMWNLNASFLNAYPHFQDQYLAKVAAHLEAGEETRKELMT